MFLARPFPKFIYWLPTIIWMITIFSFSAHPSLHASAVAWQDFAVKKTAHFVEYFVFTGLLIYSLTRTTRLSWTRALLMAIIICIVYAATDEFHQSFVPGREPRIRDVLIDISGGLVMVVFSLRSRWLEIIDYRV